MKYKNFLFLFFGSISYLFGQSITIGSGASMDIGSGTDICGGSITGVLTGVGTKCQGTLPVELASFTFSLNGSHVTLNWITVTEVNNYGFEVERRAVNNQQPATIIPPWSMIGLVSGNGTSNDVHGYSFSDLGLPSGCYVYRLKQVDNGGMFKYSQSIEVDVKSVPIAIGLSQNYPNPFNPSTKITFAVATTEHARVVVFNLLGQQVKTLFDGIAEGQKEYSITFNASRLASGIYFYKMQTPTQTDVRRMMLMK